MKTTDSNGKRAKRHSSAAKHNSRDHKHHQHAGHSGHVDANKPKASHEHHGISHVEGHGTSSSHPHEKRTTVAKHHQAE